MGEVELRMFFQLQGAGTRLRVSNFGANVVLTVLRSHLKILKIKSCRKKKQSWANNAEWILHKSTRAFGTRDWGFKIPMRNEKLAKPQYLWLIHQRILNQWTAQPLWPQKNAVTRAPYACEVAGTCSCITGVSGKFAARQWTYRQAARLRFRDRLWAIHI